MLVVLSLVASSWAFVVPNSGPCAGRLTVKTSVANKVGVEVVGQIAKAAAGTLKNAPSEDADEKESNDELSDGIRQVVDTVLGYIEEGKEAAKAPFLEYASYPSHPEDPHYDLTGMMPMLKGVPPFPGEWFDFCKIFRILWRLLETIVVRNFPKFNIDDRFMKVFGKTTMTAPGIIDDDLWATDRGFAQQFLSGTNPVMIRRAEKADLTGDLLQVPGVGEKLAANDLYVVNYNFWDPTGSPRTVASKPPTWPKLYYYSPIVLLAVDKDANQLMPVAIQIDKKVYTPSTTTPEEWTYAKMVVTSADENVHEWVSHLGRTHLTIEPQIIAARNQLKPKKHFLYDFLEPHFQDTLFLNWAARLTLLYYEPASAEVPAAEAMKNSGRSVADTQFAVGAFNFLKILLGYWQTFEFDHSAFDTELERRGISEDAMPPNYFYAEDGKKLWNALGTYCTDVVAGHYADDDAVLRDDAVQEWAAEQADPKRGKIHKFPSPMPDRKTLARCLQTTIWTTSGMHAAVNFPQFDFMAYQPNRPVSLLQPVDVAENQSRDWIFKNAISTKVITNSIAQIVWLLTLPSRNTLGDLQNKPKSGTPWATAYDAFKSQLKSISSDINQRNDRLRKQNDVPFPYTYLDPPNVPASIDI